MRTALYIIGWSYDGPIKFGICANPSMRMANLQNSCPYRLQVFGAWWLPSREHARAFESACLAEVREWALRGEWVDVKLLFAQRIVANMFKRSDVVLEPWQPPEHRQRAQCRYTSEPSLGVGLRLVPVA